jgi:DNA primase
VILAALVVNPWLVHRFEGELERLETTGPDHGRILAALAPARDGATQARLIEALGEDALEKLFAPRHVQLCAGVRQGGDPEAAEQCVRGELEKLFRARGARSRRGRPRSRSPGSRTRGSPGGCARPPRGSRRRSAAVAEDRTEFVVADNGVRVSKDEKAASQALFAAIDFGKGGRRTGRTE